MLAAALAAGLLISATLWILQSKTAEKSPSVANTENNEIIPADSNAHPSETVKPIPDRASPENAVAENTASENANARELSVTRQPTPYEELLFQAAVDKRRAAIKAFREQIGQTDRIATGKAETESAGPCDHRSRPVASVRRQCAGSIGVREENAALQEEIFAAMLARGDAQSVGFYLDFVSNRNYADRALHALDGMKTPPVDMLFDFLHVAQAPRRLAAALVARAHRRTGNCPKIIPNGLRQRRPPGGDGRAAGQFRRRCIALRQPCPARYFPCGHFQRCSISIPFAFLDSITA